ncbi:MAG: hypothetical protein ACOCRK_07800 [bacterium]
MTKEDFKDDMIKRGDARESGKSYRPSGEKKPAIGRMMRNPYKISGKGSIYSTNYVIVEKYEYGQYNGTELE